MILFAIYFIASIRIDLYLDQSQENILALNETSNRYMGVRLDVAKDKYGNTVPISEAESRTKYYECPRCGGNLIPRTGDEREHHFAHEPGVLDETECPLGTQRGYEELLEEQRESETEANERENRIEIFLKEFEGSHVELIGRLPTTDKEQFSPTERIDSVLSDLSIESSGTKETPVPSDFDPYRSEVLVRLDPDAEEYTIEIEGNGRFEEIEGVWSAEKITTDSVFVGETDRARRPQTHEFRIGERVYAVERTEPPYLPDDTQVYPLGEHVVVGFDLSDETEDLLEQFVGESIATKHGYHADIMLPARAHPTTEAPIRAPSTASVVLGIEPKSETDPLFEIVPFSRRNAKPLEVEPTGAKNPRFVSLPFPRKGSSKFTVHQRGTPRHRLVQLETCSEEELREPLLEYELGIEVTGPDGSEFLDPLKGPLSVTLNGQAPPHSLQKALSYSGPEDLKFDVVARRLPPKETATDTAFGVTFDEIQDKFTQWIVQEYSQIQLSFETVGTVEFTIDSQTEVDPNERLILATQEGLE